MGVDFIFLSFNDLFYGLELLKLVEVGVIATTLLLPLLLTLFMFELELEMVEVIDGPMLYNFCVHNMLKSDQNCLTMNARIRRTTVYTK